jgi:hypothetical protein
MALRCVVRNGSGKEKYTIEAMGHEIFLLKKERFGKRTEKVHRAQLSLFAELVGELIAESETALEAELDKMEAEAPSEPTSKVPDKKKRKKKARTPLAPHRTEVIPVPDEERPCPQCGEMRCALGHVKSVVVEYTPPKVDTDHLTARQARLVILRSPTAHCAPFGLCIGS